MGQRAKNIYLINGEAETQEWSWATEVRRDSTSVSSSAWSLATGDTAITLSGAALSSNVASVKVTAAAVGFATLTNTATLADGQILKRWARVEVREADE